METEEYPRELDDSGCVQDAECSIMKAEAPQGIPQVGLLDLSDDVLLCILKNCAPMELKALAYTCPRLARIALEWSLWLKVDARAEPYDKYRVHWMLKYALNKRTTELLLRGHAEEAASCEQFARSEQERLEEEGTAPRQADDANCTRPSMSVDWEGAEVRYNALNNGPAYVIREMPMNRQPLQNTVTPPFFSSQTRLDESSTNKPDTDTGCAGPRVTVFASAMKHISEYCNLTSLALEDCNINLLTTGLDTFPRTLKRLSLKGTRCYNMPRPHKTFLFKLHDYLPDLEYLNVSECGWLEASSFLALSKLTGLRQLIVKDCSRLTEFVAYAALATRYGFKKLEVLDLRGSPIGDSELSAFAMVNSLKTLKCSAITSSREECSEHVHRETSYEWERQVPDYLKKFQLDVELLGFTDDTDQKLKQHIASPESEPCGLSIVVSLNELRREQIEVQRWRDREANAGDDELLDGNDDESDGDFDPEGDIDNDFEGSDNDEDGINVEERDDVSAEEVDRNIDEELVRIIEEGDRNNDEERDRVSVDERDKSNVGERDRANVEERDKSNDEERDRVVDVNNRNSVENESNCKGDVKNDCSDNLKRKFEETDTKEMKNEDKKTDLDKSVSSESNGVLNSKKRRIDKNDDNHKPSSRDVDKDKGNSDDEDDDDMNGGSSVVVMAKQKHSDETMEAGESDSNCNLNKTANTKDNSKTDVNEPSTSKTNSERNTNKAPNGDDTEDNKSNDGANNSENEEEIYDPSRFPFERTGPIPYVVRRRRLPVVLRGTRRNVYVRHFVQEVEVRPENVNNDEPELRHSPALNRLQRLANVHAQPGVNRYRNPQNLRHPVIYVDYGHPNCHHPTIAPELLDPNYRENLVTDLAIMRFGVSNVEEMTHIRIHFPLRSSANRMERTNLEELVVTGYRLITDATLVHLATAAPMLRRLDLTGTAVTQRGVETFKTLRPECEVLHSDFVDRADSKE